ncbi:flagellar hook-length control protein FliK [Malaciobacter canalis]|nr:flagellar hook-length control protein FliK [Malaciobacter canalis]
MLVGNNSLLNILLPNQDNKLLKDVLKEADSKALDSMMKNNSSIQDVLKNLFEDIKSGNKNNETIQNILKNSTLFKDLGSFTNTLKTLLSQVANEPSFSKYKPMLESFLTQIDNVNENNLKELLSKSGVFLESKILEKANSSNLPPKLLELLNQIKNIIKNLDSPQAQQINEIISKLSTSPNQTASSMQSDIKSMINLLQEASKNLSDKNVQTLNNLTNQLKSINVDAQLIESKLQNSSNTQNIKDLITVLKTELSQIKSLESANVLRNLTSLQNMDFNQQEVKSSLSNILSSLDFQSSSIKNTNLQEIANKLTQTLQNTNLNSLNLQSLNEQKQQITNQLKDVLSQLKTEVLINKNIEPQKLLGQIDNILAQKDIFSNNNTLEPKALLNQLLTSTEMKNSSTLNTNISNLINQLKNLNDDIVSIENKIQNNQIVTNEKANVLNQIKESLNLLKNELLQNNTIQSKVLVQTIDKLLNMQNLFDNLELPADFKLLQSQNNSLSTFQSNFLSNINSLLLNLKETISNISSNPNSSFLQNEILKTVDKIENSLKEGILTATNLQNIKNDNSTIQNDMKSILLQMQEELASKSLETKSLNEASKNIDKLLFQVDYYQLLSLSSNSNYVYLPFLWDMLEDGSISMKKINEKKFYCEINLTLKDFGQVQLLLALYEKNKIDLTVFASRDVFKKLLREHLTKLKQSLNSVGLIPMDIKLIDLEKRKKEQETTQNIYSQKSSELQMGLNIRA